MKSILIILCFISYGHLHAQSFRQEDITGEWVCREFINTATDPKEKETMEILKKGFTNARFIFGSDGIFILKLPKEAPAAVKTIDFLNNKKWYFDPGTSGISIGPRSENLMQIDVRRENGFPVFLIHDTPATLRMEKVK